MTKVHTSPEHAFGILLLMPCPSRQRAAAGLVQNAAGAARCVCVCVRDPTRPERSGIIPCAHTVGILCWLCSAQAGEQRRGPPPHTPFWPGRGCLPARWTLGHVPVQDCRARGHANARTSTQLHALVLRCVSWGTASTHAHEQGGKNPHAMSTCQPLL